MKKLFAILIFALPLGLLFTSCNETPEDPATKTFRISFPTVDNGTATAMVDDEPVTKALAGTVITLVFTPDEGYKLHSLSATPDGIIAPDTEISFALPGKIFVMPAADVTITPGFIEAEFVSKGGYFGDVNFFSAKQWEIGNHIWSDMVMASRCDKDDFDGGTYFEYKVDCRRSEGFGHLFSWSAVDQYADELCPAGWRIPTRSDFFDLDVAMGGSGSGGTGIASDFLHVWQNYIDEWGPQPSGYARNSVDNPDVVFPGAVAGYWSQTSIDDDFAYYLYIYSMRVYPQRNDTKELGMSVRCVTDRLWTRKSF